MDSTTAYNAIIQDLAANPGDILTSDAIAYDLCYAILQAYAKARWQGDPKEAAAAVIEQFIDDHAFELEYEVREAQGREAFDRHMSELGF